MTDGTKIGFKIEDIVRRQIQMFIQVAEGMHFVGHQAERALNVCSVAVGIDIGIARRQVFRRQCGNPVIKMFCTDRSNTDGLT